MNNRLYVGHLSYNTTKEHLHKLFSRAGAVKSVTIPVDRSTQLPRNFAFVEMVSADEASAAIHLLNNCEVDGHKIQVSEVQSSDSADRHQRHRDHSG